MIAPNFYTQGNLVKNYFNGKVKHYPVRPPVVVVKQYPYRMKRGDTIYQLSTQVFNEDQQFLWYIISDSNALREVDSWEEGDTVYLPELVVKELLAGTRRASSSRYSSVVFPTAGGGIGTTPDDEVDPAIVDVTFISLPDTPVEYVPLKILRTNAANNAVEFIDEGDIDHDLLKNWVYNKHLHMLYDPQIKAYLISA